MNQNCLSFSFPQTVTYVQQVLDHMAKLDYGSLVSVTGRYYAMDRDKRFERIQVAYDGLVQGKGEKVSSSADIIPVSV